MKEMIEDEVIIDDKKIEITIREILKSSDV
jgi:hypothetical protein